MPNRIFVLQERCTGCTACSKVCPVTCIDMVGRPAEDKAKGVKCVCVPNRSTKSPERKREQKKRWFRKGQKWRTGSEGRISVVKRRHGLDRCRYKGTTGMQRWVGLGVIGDNLITIGSAMAKKANS